MQLFTDVVADARAEGADRDGPGGRRQPGPPARRSRATSRPASELAAQARAEAASDEARGQRVWATSVLAHLRLRQDVAAGLAAVAEALDAARRIVYPAAIGVNLRSVAWGTDAVRPNIGPPPARCPSCSTPPGTWRRRRLRGALYTTAELLHADRCPILEAARRDRRIAAVRRPDDRRRGGLLWCELPPTTAARSAAVTRSPWRSANSASYLAAEPVPRRATDQAAGDVVAEARFVDRGDFWEVIVRRAGDPRQGVEGHGRPRPAAVEPRARDPLPGADRCGRRATLDRRGARPRRPAQAIEQRIRDLQEDVDAAEADNDYARAERAQAELDTLVEHLTAALGLGGRSRRAREHRRASPLGGHPADPLDDPPPRRRPSELGRHLEASITTGTYCVYRPERPVIWHT